jgi:hypothetical protein
MEFKVSKIIERLKELNVGDNDYLTFSCTEGCDVWHINESHVEESVAETATAELLAGLLASGVPVYAAWGEVSEGNDILSYMRFEGLLDDYDRQDWFKEYLTEKLVETIYEGEYSLEYSTTQYDYKRGRCDISTAVRVRAGDLYNHDSPDSLVGGFNLSVKTKAGTLTLD